MKLPEHSTVCILKKGVFKRQLWLYRSVNYIPIMKKVHLHFKTPFISFH